MESFLADVAILLIHLMEFCKYFHVLNDLIIKKGFVGVLRHYKGSREWIVIRSGSRVTLKLPIYP